MRERGFTLLEVLLAMTVLGVVVAMLSLSLSATLRVVSVTEKQGEVYNLAQIAMRRMTEDLAAAVSTSKVPFVGQKDSIRDRRADSLVFASQARLVLNPEKENPGVAIIRYQVRADPEDERKWKLLRTDTPVLPGIDYTGEQTDGVNVGPTFLLADSLRSVQFRYVTRDGQEFESWREEQGTGTNVTGGELPAAVRCTLEFWIDPDQEQTLVFGTSVLIPAEPKDEK